MVAHTFNPTTREAEAGGQSLLQCLTTDGIPDESGPGSVNTWALAQFLLEAVGASGSGGAVWAGSVLTLCLLSS